MTVSFDDDGRAYSYVGDTIEFNCDDVPTDLPYTVYFEAMYKDGTRAFDPSDYPGIPSDDLVKLLKHIAKTDTEYVKKSGRSSVNKKIGGNRIGNRIINITNQNGRYSNYTNF